MSDAFSILDDLELDEQKEARNDRRPRRPIQLQPHDCAIDIRRLNATLKMLVDRDARRINYATCPIMCIGVFAMIITAAFGIFLIYRAISDRW